MTQLTSDEQIRQALEAAKTLDDVAMVSKVTARYYPYTDFADKLTESFGEWFLREHHLNGRSVKELSNEMNVGYGGLNGLVKRMGLPQMTKGEASKFRGQKTPKKFKSRSKSKSRSKKGGSPSYSPKRDRIYLRDAETGELTKEGLELKELGDLCFESYDGMISTDLLVRFFRGKEKRALRYSQFTRTDSKDSKNRRDFHGMYKLIRLMSRVDPEFTNLEFNYLDRGNGVRRYFTGQENLAVEDILTSEDSDFIEGERPSDEIIEAIRKKLIDEVWEKETEYRSIQDIRNHINSCYTRSKTSLPVRLLSRRARELPDIVEQRIQEIEDPEEPIIAQVLGGTEKLRKDRNNAQKYLSTGHQKLLAYLIDPRNYISLLGEGTQIITGDFRKEDTPQWLYELFEKRIKEINRENESDELISLVDGWMRCDLVYKQTNGGIIIAEVKQNAKKVKGWDGKEFDNGLRAVQQLSGYTSAIDSTSRFKGINAPVKGYLVAYEVDPAVQGFLEREEGKGSFVIQRDLVDKYLDSITKK